MITRNGKTDVDSSYNYVLVNSSLPDDFYMQLFYCYCSFLPPSLRKITFHVFIDRQHESRTFLISFSFCYSMDHWNLKPTILKCKKKEVSWPFPSFLLFWNMKHKEGPKICNNKTSWLFSLNCSYQNWNQQPFKVKFPSLKTTQDAHLIVDVSRSITFTSWSTDKATLENDELSEWHVKSENKTFLTHNFSDFFK